MKSLSNLAAAQRRDPQLKVVTVSTDPIDSAAQIAARLAQLGVHSQAYAFGDAPREALQYAIDHGVSHLAIFSDSELLVRQINGQYRVKNPALQRLHRAALDRMRRLKRVTISHVRREENREADRLANRAMDTRQDEPEGIASGLLE